MQIQAVRRELAVFIGVVTFAAPSAAFGQQALTTADYDRAAKMLSFNVNPLVIDGAVKATWLPDSRFYYRRVSAAESDWVVIDPARKTSTPLFRAPAIAQALTRAGAGKIDPRNIPAQSAELSRDGLHVTLMIGNHRWECEVGGGSCTAAD